MRVGILETGRPPAALEPVHGSYAAMTRVFLGASHDYVTYPVCDGKFPPSPHGCDAFAITGSACGVKDGLAWVDALVAFLREVRGTAHLVGICFGHQVMAQAFGGDVAKAPQGWGLGLQRYRIRERAPWMDAVDQVRAMASHQDQVLTLPPRCRVLGESAFTPHAILAYDDHPSVSVQFHPEFTPEFSRALLEHRRAPDVASVQSDAALASLDGDHDNARLARWIGDFLASTPRRP